MRLHRYLLKNKDSKKHTRKPTTNQ